MAVGQPKYDDVQRRAVEHAKLNREFPASAIVDLASRGELEDINGAPIEPFDIKRDSVYSIANAARKRRSRTRASELAKQPREEAVGTLWVRMMEVADRETERMVNRSRNKPNQPIDAEHARKTARFVRELASQPAPGERGAKPGAGGNATRTESPTADKAALAIMAAAKGGAIEAAPDDLHITPSLGSNGTENSGAEGQGRADGDTYGGGDDNDNDTMDGDEETPGSRASSEINRLLVQSVTTPE